MKLEHIAINVPDPAGTARWLVESLGLRIVVHNTTSPFMHFVADESGTMIELYNNPAAAMPDYANLNSFNLHFAFASADIEADRARLIAAGATMVAESTITPAGDKLVFLRDPWNVPLQLVQRVKPLV